MRVSTLYFALSTLILFNLLYGPLVRATDSGLACPDWPLCHGKFVPEMTFQIFMEVGHRYYSGLLGLGVVFAFFWIRRFPEPLSRVSILPWLSLFFLGTQVTLGALTVTKLLNPATVNLHLLNAVVLLITCYTIALLARSQESSFFWNFGAKGKWLFAIGLFLIFYQLFLGARVSSNYAGLACPDFPMCYNSWFPEWIGTIRYQMEHRWMGYLVVLWIFGVTIWGVFSLDNPMAKLYLKICTYLVVFQILLGAINVLYHLPKGITVLHTLNAVFVLMAYYSASYYQFRQAK